MTQEFIKFMLQDSLKHFKLLHANVGKKVKATFNKVIDDRPVQAQISGVLSDVKDFANVTIGGKVIDFVSKNNIISTITLPETGETLYDKTLVVNPNTKVRGNLMNYMIGIMGSTGQKNKKQTFAAQQPKKVL